MESREENINLPKVNLLGQSAVISIVVAFFSMLTFVVWFDIEINISDGVLGTIIIISTLFAGVGIVSSYLGNNMWRK